MKIVDYKIKDMEYPEMLALFTLDDVMKYAKENAEFVSDDYAVCLQIWLQKKISGDFMNTCAHVSKSYMPHIAAFTAIGRNDGHAVSVLEVANEMDRIQNSKIQNMLKAVMDGNIVFVNNVGGYHWRNANEIKILYELEITDEQLHNFIYNPKNYMQEGSNEDVYIIYHKHKCYMDHKFANHLYLCHKYNVNEDDCIKLIWSKGGMEYGIPNLKLSPVYDLDKPVLSKQDLDIIEKQIKYIDDIKSRKSWKQKLENINNEKSKKLL